MAALSSRFCGETYGLELLRANVQNRDNNYTRFICISQNPEIYPGADRTSLMMTLPHKPGALYHVLSKFYALGINLQKLESRPSRTGSLSLCSTLIWSAPSMPRRWSGCSGIWRRRASSAAIWGPIRRSSADAPEGSGVRPAGRAAGPQLFPPPSTGSWQAMTTNWWNSHQRRWSPSSGRGVSVD